MTHDFVVKTFIVYITLKAMIFLPLAWAAAVFWWNDKNIEGAQASLDSAPSIDGLSASTGV